MPIDLSTAYRGVWSLVEVSRPSVLSAAPQALQSLFQTAAKVHSLVVARQQQQEGKALSISTVCLSNRMICPSIQAAVLIELAHCLQEYVAAVAQDQTAAAEKAAMLMSATGGAPAGVGSEYVIEPPSTLAAEDSDDGSDYENDDVGPLDRQVSRQSSPKGQGNSASLKTSTCFCQLP